MDSRWRRLTSAVRWTAALAFTILVVALLPPERFVPFLVAVVALQMLGFGFLAWRTDRREAIVLENVEQGLLTVDYDGLVVEGASPVLSEWLDAPDEAAPIWAWFTEVDPALTVAIERGFAMLRDPGLPRDIALLQLPESFQKEGRKISLEWRAVVPGSLLLVATDITTSDNADALDADRSDLLAGMEKVVEDRDEFQTFVRSSQELVDRLAEGVDLGAIRALRDGASAHGLEGLVDACDDAEWDLDSAAERQALVQRWNRTVGALGEAVSAPQSTLARLEGMAVEVKELADAAGIGPLDVWISHAGLVAPRSWDALWQVIHEVIREAIEQGGQASSESSAEPPMRTVLSLQIDRAGDKVGVRITDDGSSIAGPSQTAESTEATRALFGDGSGLVTLEQVAAELGGEATVEREPGHGTTISVWLPATGVRFPEGDTPSPIVLA